MLKYCLEQWNKNHKLLEDKIRRNAKMNSCEYCDLVKLVVDFILNIDGDFDVESRIQFDTKNITCVDDGSYQGTLLFLIPMDTYQPCEWEYLMTYVGYGSCSGCDTLLSIQDYSDEPPTEQQIKDYMVLCKDILTNMVRPYCSGWRHDEDFEQVTLEKE